MTQLNHSLTAYQTIRDRIIALEADIDDETLADTLEGLTDLHEIIAAVTRSALVDEALAAGLKGHIQAFQDRMRRLTERTASRRQIARDAILEVTAITVIDEAAIPDAYWKPRDPVLDRAGLQGDLKAGIPVAGAVLSNPEPVLSLRVR